MREVADAERIRRFMRALGVEADEDVRAYFTGGATAVLLGWRPSTIDVDISFEPEADRVLRAIPRLKDELRLNVELVAPGDFVPLPAGWAGRSVFAAREGRVTFLHFDPYSQVLAKLERAHAQDLEDVRAFLSTGLVDAEQALRFFREIEPALYRYPAVDPPSFRHSVEAVLGAA